MMITSIGMGIQFSTIVDLLVLFVVVCVTIARPRSADEAIRKIALKGKSIARRRLLSCALVGMITLVVRVALLPVWHIPRPSIHDEFSYLLGADTFASGRLTNPRHPLWQFFESIHILITPTYTTIYPPGQSLVMALGQVLLGHPWFGVWLSCGVMVAAICWAIQGWLPARWAMLGAVCAMLPMGIGSYWMNSYWGGAVAAIGGCLVIGAYPRLTRHHQMGCAWAMGAGLILLANTRPYEGAIASLPVVGATIWYLARQPFGRIVRFAGPMVVCMLASVTAMGYYNARVTGNALEMPHVEHAKQYAMVPLTMFLDSQTRSYRHEDLRYHYAVWEMNAVREEQTAFFSTRGEELWIDDKVFLGLLLTVPLLFAPFAIRDRRIRLPMVFLGANVAAAAVGAGFKSHYLAPATGCFFILLVQCMRHLRAARFPGRQAGRFLLATLPLGAVLAFAVTQTVELRLRGSGDPLAAVSRKPQFEQRLLQSGPKQLVFVQYGHLTGPDDVVEWVYNPADIDRAPVVWAHDMGAEENRKLLDYYPDRKAWLFEPDASPPRVTEYARQ